MVKLSAENEDQGEPTREREGLCSAPGREDVSELPGSKSERKTQAVTPLLCVRDLHTQDKGQGNYVSSRGNKLSSSTR